MKKCFWMVIFLIPLLVGADEKKHLYVTWEVMEVDKSASAWLIKRFVDREAEFKFVPNGEMVTEGIPFDTPDSEFRRSHNLSTFETILKKYGITDEALVYIGKITHEIEINFWGEREMKESEKVEREVKEIINGSKDGHECFRKSFAYFDNFLKELRSSSK